MAIYPCISIITLGTQYEPFVHAPATNLSNDISSDFDSHTTDTDEEDVKNPSQACYEWSEQQTNKEQIFRIDKDSATTQESEKDAHTSNQ